MEGRKTRSGSKEPDPAEKRAKAAEEAQQREIDEQERQREAQQEAGLVGEPEDETQENTPVNLVEAPGVAAQREADIEEAQRLNEPVEVPDDATLLSRHQAKADYPDQYSGEAVLYGSFVVVTEGENEGLYGVYIENVSGDDSGRPDVVIVRERNSGRRVSVKYDSLAPAQAGDIGRGR